MRSDQQYRALCSHNLLMILPIAIQDLDICPSDLQLGEFHAVAPQPLFWQAEALAFDVSRETGRRSDILIGRPYAVASTGT